MANPAHGEKDDLLFDHNFGGEYTPVASTSIVTSGITGYTIGPYKITGSLHDTDSGVTATNIRNGAARVTSSATADGDGVAIGTAVIFDVGAMGTLTLETRVQRPATTAGNIFIGFAGLNADEIAPTLTSTSTTHTLTDTNQAGFHIDTSLTASTAWHCVFVGGSVTGPTDSNQTVTGTTNDRNVKNAGIVDIVAGEYDLLKLDIFNNGTVRWYINEELVQEQAGAVSTTVDLAAIVGIWSTTTTVATMDVDYLIVKGKRDWAR